MTIIESVFVSLQDHNTVGEPSIEEIDVLEADLLDIVVDGQNSRAVCDDNRILGVIVRATALADDSNGGSGGDRNCLCIGTCEDRDTRDRMVLRIEYSITNGSKLASSVKGNGDCII